MSHTSSLQTCIIDEKIKVQKVCLLKSESEARLPDYQALNPYCRSMWYNHQVLCQGMGLAGREPTCLLGAVAEASHPGCVFCGPVPLLDN